MDTTRLAEALLDRTAAFATTVTGADPATRVPTCPDWPLRVLVGHIGQAHRWSAGIVRSGPSPVPDPHDADAPENWADWLRQGAEDLAKTVLDAGETPVWTFFGEQHARFWLRRMLNDTTVHHADAALATGTAFEVVPDLAEDVITEWLEMLANPITAGLKPDFAQLHGTGQTLRLTDGDRTWRITREPDGITWTRDGADADVTLAGPVRDLLLVLTRRRPLDDVTLTGDRALAEHWLAHTAA
ncbi:TIGR03083 family protein [Amycolatopsis pretoriensis]|uniref:TIGR03083 family protein n=1 Tax=Amycolatopsis pretoriensis TaxID=218821 RepID=A0A1H5R7Z4_9PSEU|nr:maleylpyruvate isomerase family mycothiol-dependent enzyme [Amycolatopsis pretoriensis]SEF33711.1 TIGR03083 family protein [Amycolatopsis pretoriensis]